MKSKSFSLITLLWGVIFTVIGIVAPIISLQSVFSAGGAVGIIGGADAPTYKFVVFDLMDGWPFCLVLFGVSLILTGMFCLIFTQTVKSNCSIKTLMISLGLSAAGALGLVCAFMWYTITAFGEMSRHPVTYPVSIIAGLLSFGVFAVLCSVYIKQRKLKWSTKGLVIDIFTSILYLPAFFFAFSYLYGWIS